MQALATINKAGLVPQSNGSVTLTTRSGPPLPDGMGSALLTLMAQTQARYSTQTLPEGTPDMLLVEWEEMALEFGLMTFRDALLRAIRNSRFFPDPKDVRDLCVVVRRETREQRRLKELAEVRPLALRAKKALTEERAKAAAERREPDETMLQRFLELDERYMQLLTNQWRG